MRMKKSLMMKSISHSSISSSKWSYQYFWTPKCRQLKYTSLDFKIPYWNIIKRIWCNYLQDALSVILPCIFPLDVTLVMLLLSVSTDFTLVLVVPTECKSWQVMKTLGTGSSIGTIAVVRKFGARKNRNRHESDYILRWIPFCTGSRSVHY